MPRPTSLSLVGALAALVLVLGGCSDDDGGGGGAGAGGGGGGRPTVEDVAAVLPSDGLSADQVDCLAEAFVASDVSDDGLRAIVDAGSVAGAGGLSRADQAAIQTAAGEAVACSAAAGTTDPELSPPPTG